MKLENYEVLLIMLVTILFGSSFICYIVCFCSSSYANKDSLGYYVKSSNTQTQMNNSSLNEDKDITVFKVSADSSETLLNKDYSVDRDSSMEQIFYSVIIGDYVINENMEYNFGVDGTFSGFFDDKNRSVKGYTYEIFVVNEEAYINIYNDEKTAKVSYELILLGESKLALYYPAADLKIVLK